MKLLSCTLCKSKPNIKINKLNYCNACFLKMVEMKCHRSLRKLPYKSKILLILKNTTSSNVLLSLLSRYQNKNIHFFAVFCDDKNANIDLDSYDLPILEKVNACDNLVEYSNTIDESEILNIQKLLRSNSHQDVYNRIIQMNIDLIFYHQEVEQQVIKVFRSLSMGENLTHSIVNDTVISINGRSVYFFNLFQEIKRKEIAYYAYLNNLHVKKNIIKKNPRSLETVIELFISKIDKDNSLALFNVLNTVKKL